MLNAQRFTLSVQYNAPHPAPRPSSSEDVSFILVATSESGSSAPLRAFGLMQMILRRGRVRDINVTQYGHHFDNMDILFRISA